MIEKNGNSAGEGIPPPPPKNSLLFIVLTFVVAMLLSFGALYMMSPKK